MGRGRRRGECYARGGGGREGKVYIMINVLYILCVDNVFIFVSNSLRSLLLLTSEFRRSGVTKSFFQYQKDHPHSTTKLS